jgi:EmrB/QacA subfamily drug resistance transporter
MKSHEGNRGLNRKSATIALIVASAYFMENFDGTVITTALPSIAHSFASTAPATSAGITAYLFAVAIFIPISGWLADRYGSKTVFRAAIGLFTLASMLCGISGNLGEFTAARALQGVSGAMMLPVGRLIVLRATSRAEYVRAMSLVTMPGVVGQIMGPLLGGFFASYLSWRWIFFVNLPIGLLGIGLVTWLMDELAGEVRSRFDWLGAGLVGISIGCLISGLSMVAGSSEMSIAAPLLVVGTASAGLALRHLIVCPHPLLELRLLRTETFLRGAVGTLLFRLAAAAFGFVLPLLLQIVLGMTPFLSGVLVFGSALGAFVMKGSAPPILRRFGFRAVLLWNGIVSAVSMLLCIGFGVATPLLLIALILLAGGFARSLQFAALNSVVYADVEPPSMSAATSFASMLQPLASAAGIALSAGLLRVMASSGIGVGAGAVHAAVTGFGTGVTLCAIGVIALGAAWPFVAMAPMAGAELSGRRPLQKP